MTRTSTLVSLLVASILFTSSTNGQSTYVNNGTSTNYTLYAGDSLHIASGTYTGSISNWQEGAKISVASGATFKPDNFGYFLGKIYVYGNAILANIDGQTSSFRLFNYGILTITGNTYLGGNASLQNNYGATINFNGSVNNNNSSVINNGTIITKGDWYSGNNSTLINNNTLTAEGNLEVNGSTATNGGMFYTKKKLTISNAILNNNCRTIADATIEVSNSTVNNNGLFWATNTNNNSTIINSGTISNIDGKVKSVNFTNNGNITGKGYLYFTGLTTNNGTIGRSGTTTDTLRVYDLSRNDPNTIFDNQWGTIYPNTRYVTFPVPDTIYAFSSCAPQYSLMASALPVKWNNFFVNLSNNIPAISWSSEQEEGTYFEIQRSYNSIDFSSVTIVKAEIAKTNYYYQDREVNAQANIVYYRIKAIELSGAKTFTETKVIRFSSKPGISIQATPNPFTNQFNINFQSPEKGILVIKLFSINGQMQFTKSVSIGKGFNSIAVTEAASLPKGIYMLQFNMNNLVVASEKIVKR